MLTGSQSNTIQRSGSTVRNRPTSQWFLPIVVVLRPCLGCGADELGWSVQM
jgi:hypothetical protein